MILPHVEPCPLCSFHRPYPSPCGCSDPVWRASCPRCGLLGPEAIDLEPARVLWNDFAVRYYPVAGEAYRLAEACLELVAKLQGAGKADDVADMVRLAHLTLNCAAINLRMRKL